MRIIKILPSFERSIKKLSSQDKQKVKKTLEKLNDFIVSGILPKGLGLKKINKDKYELRVDIHFRIIMKTEKESLYIVLAGTHQDIKKYLKKYR